MKAIRANFDGAKIILPEQLRPKVPGEVIVIFQDDSEENAAIWAGAQSDAFAKAWDNDEDAVYDNL